jgi:hypothetical protein
LTAQVIYLVDFLNVPLISCRLPAEKFQCLA